MPEIPNTNNNFRVYLAGRGLIGIATVTLPNIANMTDDLKGSGIFGTLTLPVAAHVAAMTMTINWNTPVPDIGVLFSQEKMQLQLYAAIQTQDMARMKVRFKQFKLVVIGMPTGLNLGTLDVGVKQAPANEWAVEYIRGWMDGVELFEIGPMDAVYTLNGVDYGAEIRTALGM
jgi:uncharacterized protein